MAHYVNNKAFYQNLKNYKERKKIDPNARVCDEIGSTLLLIANRYSRLPKFYSYAFREDMVSDAVENCLRYIDNFDVDKYQNPFAYFTQIIFFAFLRRIEKEKKYLYTKYKAMEDVSLFGSASVSQESDDLDYNIDLGSSDYTKEHMGQFIKDFEERLNR